MRKILIALAAVQSFGTAAASAEPEAAALFDRVPQHILERMEHRKGLKSVVHGDLAWTQPVVTVAFNGGSDRLYALIEDAANDWTRSGGELSFSFRDDRGRFRRWSRRDRAAAADMRIAFNTGKLGGYWSEIGTMAHAAEPNAPTMNLEGFPSRLRRYLRGANAQAWRASYERSVVLHEFGHALGLAHEHFHPDCQGDLDIEAAIRHYEKSDRWSADTARFNVDAAFYFSTIGDKQWRVFGIDATDPDTSREIDRASVMMYDLPATALLSGDQSACLPTTPFATTLSAGDRAAYLSYYRDLPEPEAAASAILPD